MTSLRHTLGDFVHDLGIKRLSSLDRHIYVLNLEDLRLHQHVVEAPLFRYGIRALCHGLKQFSTHGIDSERNKDRSGLRVLPIHPLIAGQKNPRQNQKKEAKTDECPALQLR